MDRRAFARRLSSIARRLVFALSAGVAGLSGTQERGTGDLGVVIERASGSVLIVAHTTPEVLARVEEGERLKPAVAEVAAAAGLGKNELYEAALAARRESR